MKIYIRGFEISVLHQRNTSAISAKERSAIRTFKDRFTKEEFSLLSLPVRKKEKYFIGGHEEGAENARKYKKIDVTSKTRVKVEAVVTETSFL